MNDLENFSFIPFKGDLPLYIQNENALNLILLYQTNQSVLYENSSIQIYHISTNCCLILYQILKQLSNMMTEKAKGVSIKHLQTQMKKELTKLSHIKAKSECFSKSSSKFDFDLIQDQPQKVSHKSISSRKLNTTAAISSKSPKLLRQDSLGIMLTSNESRNKIQCIESQNSKLKLKKKKTNKDQSMPFIKLKRGDTLPQQSSHLIVSSTSLEAKCKQSGKAQEKTAKDYQQIISKYKKKIDQLENIIEAMME